MAPEKRQVYLDHAATTPVDPAVVEAMLPAFNQFWGNPSSLYEQGRAANGLMETAREQVATTVIHEVAHHFGIDDDRLDELGWG